MNEISLKNNTYKDSTFCNLLVDEVLEISQTPEELESVNFDDKLKEALDRLVKAQRKFSDKPEFNQIEARLWNKLGESEKAVNALSTAITKAHNGRVFLTLANILKNLNRKEEAIEVLEKGINQFPSEQSLNLLMARLLVSQPDSESESNKIENYFESSFSPGDKNYIERFYYGEYLYFVGKYSKSKQIFKQVDKLAEPSFKKFATNTDDEVTRKFTIMSGKVTKIMQNYFLIHRPGIDTPIFASINSIEDGNFDKLELNCQVKFKISFNRKGPVALKVNIV